MRKRLSAVVLLALLALLIGAAAALASSHVYTPQHPAYNENLAHGRLSTQVNFHSSSGPIFQWGWQLNASTYGAATGPMVETADIYCNGSRVKGYHDHHVVPASYLVHSSFKPLKTSCNYQLAINESFPIRGGERFVYTRYWFYISYA